MYRTDVATNGPTVGWGEQAGELAKEDRAQFFSFGTNDLTQMTFGFSRDDAEAHFLPSYVKQVSPPRPLVVLDMCLLRQKRCAV
jgi:phosphoenolpyruvate synthase/pyruvate phosphate dikinase